MERDKLQSLIQQLQINLTNERLTTENSNFLRKITVSVKIKCEHEYFSEIHNIHNEKFTYTGLTVCKIWANSLHHARVT